MRILARIVATLVFTISFSIPVNAENSPSSTANELNSNPQATEASVSPQIQETGLFKNDIIEFDGKSVEFSTIAYNDRIYVKLRDLCYNLKCNIEVDNETKIINILENPKTVQENVYADKEKILQPIEINLDLSSFNIKINGINTYMESIIYKGRTFVPIGVFSEMFDRKVDWFQEQKMVKVSTVPNVLIGSVNGQALFRKDYEYFYNPQYINLKNSSSTEPSEVDIKYIKDTAFDNLVLTTILIQKAAKANITLDESDYQVINDTINNYINGYGGVENFRSIMEENQITLCQFSDNIRNSMLINKFLDSILKDITASEETLKKYYEDYKATFIEPEKVKAKHILFLTKDQYTNENYDEQKKAEIKKKAEEVLAQIKTGADFNELMNKYTEDPGIVNYPDGYTFARGEMVQEFEDKAFSMKIGEFSDLVETDYGYHIIKLEEKLPETQLTLADIRDSIKPELDKQEKQAYFEKLLVQYKAESEIKKTLE